MKFALSISLGTLLLASPTTAGGFCERMAEQTRMKPVAAAPPGTAWQVNKLGGIGTFLFGGSVNFMIQAFNVDGVGVAASKFTDCTSAAKSIACTLAGPGVIKLTVNGTPFEFAAEKGEAAKVTITGGKLRCDTLAAPSEASQAEPQADD